MNPYREKIRDSQSNERPTDIISGVLRHCNISLCGCQRRLQLQQCRMVVRFSIEYVLELGELLLDFHGECVLQDERLVSYRRDGSIHLAAGLQHLQQAIVQIVVAVEAQPDGGTAQDRHDGKGNFEAGN